MAQTATKEPSQAVAMQPSLIRTLAAKYDMDPARFADTIKATCIQGNVSNEDFAAFLMVAREYDLNPVTREIFAFPKRGGGIQPIVSIDGWLSMINRQPQFDGMEFVDAVDDKGELVSITCKMFRKDRSHPIEITEYMDECKRPTDTWRQWPARMLRHKAAIQCARYAFGFSGIMEPDEFERSGLATERSAGPVAVTAPSAPTREQAVTIEATAEETASDEVSSRAMMDELSEALTVADTLEDLSQIYDEAMKDGTIDALRKEFPKDMAKLIEGYNARREAFAQKPAGGSDDADADGVVDDSAVLLKDAIKELNALKTDTELAKWWRDNEASRDGLTSEQLKTIVMARDQKRKTFKSA